MNITWQWYLKNELMIITLWLIFFGLLWFITNESTYPPEFGMAYNLR